VIDVVVQRWTFSRPRENSAAHVGQREPSPMSNLRSIDSKAWVMVIMMEKYAMIPTWTENEVLFER
jgi:hypothetical protein